jgi:hypothetical protein
MTFIFNLTPFGATFSPKVSKPFPCIYALKRHFMSVPARLRLADHKRYSISKCEDFYKGCNEILFFPFLNVHRFFKTKFLFF